MGKFQDLTGKKFGRLTVLEYKGNRKWLCRCDCGNEKIIVNYDLKSGKTKSCGCLNRENTIKRNLKHGHRYTRIYRIWLQLKNRCLNKNAINYFNYGGRGITVCEEWKNDFMTFYNWAMDNGYSDDLSIDRIDNDGNYEPSNCRWATRLEQNRNSRHNRLITYNNVTHCVSEWSEILKMPYATLMAKINKGQFDV